MHRGSESTDGCLAALPVAAAISILLARWLPIRFEFVSSDLGIVSLATLARYPAQQEMFWFAFALVAGTLLTWLFARAFRRAGATLGVIVGCEALGTTALLSVLWLPGPAAALACGVRGIFHRRDRSDERLSIEDVPALCVSLQGGRPVQRTGQAVCN